MFYKYCWLGMLKDDRDISANSQISRINDYEECLPIFWPAKIFKNKNLHKKGNFSDMHTIIKKYRWRWNGLFLHVGNQLTMSPGYPSDRLQKARGRKIVLRPPEFMMSVLNYCRLPGFRPRHHKPCENGCVNQITFICAQ